MDGYSDGGHGSSGQMPHPPPGSPWSNKPVAVGKGQVRRTCICVYYIGKSLEFFVLSLREKIYTKQGGKISNKHAWHTCV